MADLDSLLNKISEYAPDADLDVVMRAYFYAANAHRKQHRKSGEAYFTHPLAVAFILVEQQMDVDTIATALLHDVIEDTMVTRHELEEAFSPIIGELVDGVTKIGKLEFRSKQEAAAENFRKMMLAMTADIRVILVKLADRLHNMRTLGSMPDHKKQRIAQETSDIYAPLANRLGLTRWRMELEDLCLQNLQPEAYQEIAQALEATRDERDAYIERTSKSISQQLIDRGLACSVKGRAKHLASIWRKVGNSGAGVSEVHDLLAFRVLVDDMPSCYAALGYVHSLYAPVPDRIKDYIAMPKSNGYRSLHTTVMGPEGKRVEVQIRTYAMHQVSERGVAAHWQYKEGHLALTREEVASIHSLREVFETAREVEDPDEFMEAVKIDLFHNEVFVFTPKGDIREFPKGATALDFAYSIHTDVGNSCVGARADGRMVPLRYEMRSGDHMEVLTRKDQHPRRDWLEFVRTSRAISKIRRFLREEERQTGIRMGTTILENELKRNGSSLAAVVKNGQLKKVLKERKVQNSDNLLLQLAHGHAQPSVLVRELLPDKDWADQDEEKSESALDKLISKIRERSVSPVLISGQDDVLVSFARCCNPIPGDEVAGFITRGRGISVHRRDCAQLLALDPTRRMPVEWDGQFKGQHTGGIRVVCRDTPGMAAKITKTCTDSGVNITALTMRAVGDEKAECDLEIGVHNVDELRKLIRNLNKIKGVLSVHRLDQGA
ncbi:MAG: bifunctional (p)ppGpp synthetase/guanosine-3',5'-bis(diphosphate) 3'-pyrophosphohydrolase [Myxococcota bacterium]|nr:bifunctional (p)ppGpp synthetase/guanosine-3',5'-bis(diphosphate) 3'-pyrophosphohydrolase [Myxococcota bacterium]